MNSILTKLLADVQKESLRNLSTELDTIETNWSNHLLQNKELYRELNKIHYDIIDHLTYLDTKSSLFHKQIT